MSNGVCADKRPLDHNDQDIPSKKLKKDEFSVFYNLYKEKCMTDVTFVIKDQDEGNGTRVDHRFDVHKLVFAARSNVFKGMFSGNFVQSAEIEIEDVHVTSFKTILKYIYTGHVELDGDHLSEILYAAEKYMLSDIKDAVENRFISNLNVDTFLESFEIYADAIRTFGLERFERNFLSFTQRNAWQILEMEKFCQVDRQIINFILSLDACNATELNLFESVLSWSRAECARNEILSPSTSELRNAMGTFLFKVRLPTMSFEDLVNGPVRSGILKSSEVSDLLQHIVSKSFGPNTLFLSKFNNPKPRLWFDGLQVFLPKRQTKQRNAERTSERVSSIKFKGSIDFVLLGFKVNALKELKAKNVGVYRENSVMLNETNVFLKKEKFEDRDFYTYGSSVGIFVKADIWHEIKIHCSFERSTIDEYSVTTGVIKCERSRGPEIELNFEQNSSAFSIDSLSLY